MGNLDLWNTLKPTDPAAVKQVNQRGGFSAVDAYWQFQRLTEVFGPCGKGWGYETTWDLYAPNEVVTARVELWWETKEQRVTAMGTAAWKTGGQGRVDVDAPKKAQTDALTKAASMLGLSADIFLNQGPTGARAKDLNPAFAENKYLDAAPAAQPAKAPQAASLQNEAPPAGSPLTGAEPWLDWEIKFGKYKGELWRAFYNAAPGSGHHGYIKWLVGQGPKASDNPQYAEKNARQYASYQSLLAHIDAKANELHAGAPEGEGPLTDQLDAEEIPF